MTPLQLFEVSAALVFACALQGAVGFGAGLFAIPLMVWAGEPLPSAIAIMLGGIAIQCGWNLYRYRGHVTLRELMPMLALRLATLPVGILLLGVLVGMGAGRVKQVIGAIVLLALTLQWLLRVKPRAHVAWGWTVLAGGTSGIATGLVGMGGPPVVLWVMAHDWPGRKSRSFLWASFLLSIPFNLALLVYKFGQDDKINVWGSLFTGLCLAPLVILGSELGQRVGGLMNRHRLRSAALALLLVLAMISIFGPILASTGRG